MQCEHCHKENRKEAKYCKWCGKPVVQRGALEGIVGMDDVKKQLRTIVDSYTFLERRKELGGVKLRVNAIIIGETGTGKSLLATAMRDYFFAHGIIPKSKLTVVSAVDYNRFVDKWDENIQKAKDGILFFDNVQKLLPDKYSKEVNPLDKLFVEMDSWTDGPIVVMAGLPKGLEDFLESNPAVANRFRYVFRLPTPNYQQLADICKKTLYSKYGISKFAEEADDQLKRLFKYKLKTRDDGFGYGHEAEKEAEEIFTQFISRGADASEVELSDVVGYVPEERTTEQILSDLDSFIGMDEVKRAVRDIAMTMKSNVERQQRGLGEQEKTALHIVLTGNPGTGKTTIARKLGEILAAIGYLDSGHVVEVDRSKMVSPYQGETPRVVNQLVDKAIGGILFVDEAYTLAPVSETGSRDIQGAQALETLMKRMEDDRGKFVVIAAGYRMEMENLFRVNPGFRSRFSYFLNIDDYRPAELLQILLSMSKERHYKFNDGALEKTKKLIDTIYTSRDKTFANGRTMRQLLERIATMQAERLQRSNISTMSNEEIITITEDDIPYEEPKSIDYNEVLAKLDGLVGLGSVKKEISNIASLINMQVKRGQPSASLAKHYVFTGNPGTGKTTVARIMAEVLKMLGVVVKGQLIEADRSKLVAGYSGQTAIKTNQLIDQALGGVLFIDEAYTLKQGDNDQFGGEAIDTLLKRMEDDRGRFVCIVAGYTDEMHDFIDSNPGLKSRFTETIHFDDYTAEEMSQIFVNLAASKNFTIDSDASSAIRRMMESVCLRKDKNFGNARVARQLFDQTVEHQSQRLVQLMGDPSLKEEDMFAITSADLPLEEESEARPIEEVLNDMDNLVGMRSVKNALRRLAVQQMFLKQRQALGAGNAKLMTMNFVLTGNPGTGKTTIARMMGEILHSMGILPTSRVVEASRATLVGKYVGETPRIVNNMIDKALGGILFIDEAYTLSEGDDQYGKEAIETLMKRMEDDRGKLVVVAAGYKEQMERFMQTNPGLSSRFTHVLHIEDYNEDELLAIFKMMARKEDYTLTVEAEMKLMGLICEKVMRKDKNFGNAREMRNLLDETVQNLSMRLSQRPAETLTKQDFQTITPDDIPNLQS